MPVTSAGILLHRLVPTGGGSGGQDAVEVLIAHMGGPYWARKDEGAWSIPKGEFDPAAEEPLAAARREFAEELGIPAPPGPYADLGVFRYASGKQLTVFAADGTGLALDRLDFGTFELEWPPRSGRMQSFPEVDRAEWMSEAAARERLVKGQRPALDALAQHLTATGL